VEGARALALQAIVVDDGAVLERDLGDRIGEVHRVGGAAVAFDDRDLALPARPHEHARMAGRGLGPRRGQEDDVDGLRQHHALGDGDEGAVVQERRIERGERASRSAGLAVERGLDELGLAVEHVAQAADVQAVRGGRGGEIGRVAAVDEHDLAPREGVTEVDRVEHRQVGDGRARRRAMELRPRDRGHARVPPVLLTGGREAQRLERGHSRRAQRAKPLRLRRGKARAEGLELLAPAHDLGRERGRLRRRGHREPAGASSHS
jgi:hypothetical protein